ncbi:hypothetical protein WKR88_09430 [Trinickia caryophylli]|uniref:hypothetical protein n=1 Tax=Trinickia caryophylli TaxID=28094 RepID=UPI00111C628B|nr:hypothetical protein [Trinickia caryophylli]TRX18901.1 hypothetical protein FNF07_12120 [Trinickia caryophylli]WQE10301.1 hypothetical protein U0034_10795 [Trinickia caryophylli]
MLLPVSIGRIDAGSPSFAKPARPAVASLDVSMLVYRCGRRIRFSGTACRETRSGRLCDALAMVQRARIVTESPFRAATEETLSHSPISTKI